jgi:hypothetical protein
MLSAITHIRELLSTVGRPLETSTVRLLIELITVGHAKETDVTSVKQHSLRHVMFSIPAYTLGVKPPPRGQ